MRFLKKVKLILLWSLFISLGLLQVEARNCSTQMFTTTLDSSLTYGDVIENIADECGLTLLVKDKEAKKKLQENLYFVKLNNASLYEFLDTILTENDIGYELDGNKLRIYYLRTKTFKLDYLSGDRTGQSNANINIANSNGSSTGGGGNVNESSGGDNGSRTGVSITSNDDFKFWSKIQKELNSLINRPEDDYKAPEPIINPEAGMITVTGTTQQLNRVGKYIESLSKQLKNQVLIDVNILSVTFDDSATTGIDWSQLYNLQNMSLTTNLSETAKNIVAEGSLKINNIIKFLKTQGDVKSISNPKVLTLNNQPALISVGNELFYKVQSTTSTIIGNGGGTEGTRDEINSVFAGILLDITPEISNDGSITLKINPSISDTLDAVERDSTGSRNIPPDLSRKQISSVVTMQDGQHVILGGLISSKRGTKVSKVPLLGDLPLFDHLFKREVKINNVDELVLIITPHIVNKDKELSLEDLGYRKLEDEKE
ncbi:MAG: pilus (MSHA type) biogenesis protein MshL [Epsilonproteobacteria bacterium]|nr:pilus (MSHA type) biogenesis protein MshL [Campylobacterota bacterium]